MSVMFHPEHALKLEYVRIALNMHSSGNQPYTAKDVVAAKDVAALRESSSAR